MPSRSFQTVLVANRGEIAVRVLRGLKEMGLSTVAVYSEADRDALHARRADRAVCIGPAPASQSYLDFDRVLAAARETGAQAIHPGYGFLSENADFAAACRDAGLWFIGPSAESIRMVGGKKPAKEIAKAAGVPTVPGYDGADQSPATLIAAADKVGFPLLVKASAGGGGKGMRKVDRQQDLPAALEAAKREAMSAFKDDFLVLEKFVHPARHVEIQVFGDQGGHVLHLNERECSVQRRHQKVLEESPSPVMTPALRAAMGEAAVAVARAARYENAGTVEFLVDQKGAFYFLEMNTRLQVEHPVTELVTGLDLVHLQVQVARGASLKELLPGGTPAPRGHALEARVYAEDPDQGYLPAAGVLRFVSEPEGPGVRVDSAVFPGLEIPVHSDPMLSKVIVHAPDRAMAVARMQRALGETAYLGIPTNLDMLRRVLAHPAFLRGELRTDFLDLHQESLRKSEEVPDAALVAAVLAEHLGRGNAPARAGAEAGGSAGPSLWSTLGPLRIPGGV
jgi:acetyl-CoA carboxylase biotin carboxylase subunit